MVSYTLCLAHDFSDQEVLDVTEKDVRSAGLRCCATGQQFDSQVHERVLAVRDAVNYYDWQVLY